MAGSVVVGTQQGTGDYQCDVVTLSYGKSTATIHLHGATLTSWQCDGDELIFLSSQAVLNGSEAIRGGIPLVFPEFGAWSLGPNHGFARISKFSVSSSGVDGSGHPYVILTLSDSDATRAMWPYCFQLNYSVTLRDASLVCMVSVENKDKEAFSFKTLLHTYFKVPSIKRVAVEGLQNTLFYDKLSSAEEMEQRDSITFAENVDRIYKGALEGHVIRNVASSRAPRKDDHSSTTPRTDVMLTKAQLPDTVVWNPWIEKAAAMGDLRDDEYHEFVCVEAGHVAAPKLLAPGEVWQGGQTLEVQRHR